MTTGANGSKLMVIPSSTDTKALSAEKQAAVECIQSAMKMLRLVCSSDGEYSQILNQRCRSGLKRQVEVISCATEPAFSSTVDSILVTLGSNDGYRITTETSTTTATTKESSSLPSTTSSTVTGRVYLLIPSHNCREMHAAQMVKDITERLKPYINPSVIVLIVRDSMSSSFEVMVNKIEFGRHHCILFPTEQNPSLLLSELNRIFP